MARFDVYPMPGAGEGYVVDVQADLLTDLATRVVVPLLPEIAAPKPATELNPVFEVSGKRYTFFVQAIATIHRRELGQAVHSLNDQHELIVRALDVLLTGF